MTRGALFNMVQPAAIVALGALCACGPSDHGQVDSLGPTRPIPPTFAGAGAAGWLKPGTVQMRTIARDDAFMAATNIPSAWQPTIASQYTASFYVPKVPLEPTQVPLSLLMVFGAQGTNTEVLPNWKSLADARAFLLMAVDGYQPAENGEGRSYEYYYCALKAVSDLKHDGIVADDAAFVLAGFSGGAKDAMIIGEYGGTDTFRGVLAAGCNQNLATYGQSMLYNPSALALPIVLVNATDDSIVGGATPDVVASLENSGFTAVSTMTYTGGHMMPPLAVLEQAVDSILAQ